VGRSGGKVNSPLCMVKIIHNTHTHINLFAYDNFFIALTTDVTALALRIKRGRFIEGREGSKKNTRGVKTLSTFRLCYSRNFSYNILSSLQLFVVVAVFSHFAN